MTRRWGSPFAARLRRSVMDQSDAPFAMHLTIQKYFFIKLLGMGSPRASHYALPLQVAAVCYRWQNSACEFLLVHTNGGNKWTFPKGAPEPRLSHSQAAAREAREEAGAIGVIEPRHFHIYVHSKGVFWQPEGVQEYGVKAFLMEVRQTREPEESDRKPTWFAAEKARIVLAKGREVKYARELQAVIDRAVEHIEAGHVAVAR